MLSERRDLRSRADDLSDLGKRRRSGGGGILKMDIHDLSMNSMYRTGTARAAQ